MVLVLLVVVVVVVLVFSLVAGFVGWLEKSNVACSWAVQSLVLQGRVLQHCHVLF